LVTLLFVDYNVITIWRLNSIWRLPKSHMWIDQVWDICYNHNRSDRK